MKNITKFSIAVLALLAVGGHAQTRPARKFGPQKFAPCGTTEYETKLRQQNPDRPAAAQFEQWLAPKITAARAKRTMVNGMTTNDIVTIPVVVHIIHDGDAIGENENIAAEQVLSQIVVLNQDFRKMAGTPGHNTSPVGADAEIEFCMAQRDPQGIYTTGINRYNMGSSTMFTQQIEIIKSLTQWDPEKYLNIWVFNSIVAEDGTGLAGYAQFPVNSGMPGLDDLGLATAAETDGVVMAFDCFGSEDIYPQGIYAQGMDKGRIAVHEVGHFLGLRHIWGDGLDCTATDFCDDTPAANEANYGCPTGLNSCPGPGPDMIQNHMDYTSDSCKNIFTLDQKDRMVAVLANSPRRATLGTSDGCVPGSIPANNGSLNLLHIGDLCDAAFQPEAVLTNDGTATMTTASITWDINGTEPSVYNWSGSIPPGQQATITLPAVSAPAGQNIYNATLLSVNGTADPTPVNNGDRTVFSVAETFTSNIVTITLMTDFFPGDNSWQLVDSDGVLVTSSFSQGTLSGNTLHTTDVFLENGKCYFFNLSDSNGDGMCCTSGSGYYSLETSDGMFIGGGAEFSDLATVVFRIDGNMGSGDVTAARDIILYPNPAENTLTISVSDAVHLPDGYTILNSLGQVIADGRLLTGSHAIDVSAYANGVYFVRLQSGDETKTLRFIKK